MFLWISGVFLTSIFLVHLLHKLLEQQDSGPAFGVYTKKGKWFTFKLTFLVTVIQLRQIFQVVSKLLRSTKNEELARRLDRPQILSNHPQAIDAVYFNGANSEGYHLVVGTAHRPQGIVNGFLYIKHPDLGLLGTPRLPDTTLYVNREAPDDNKDRNAYGAEGLHLKASRPMNVWRINYNGPLLILDGDGIPVTNKRPIEVRLNATWSSTKKPFNFDSDISPVAIASAMAREPWTSDYFNNLKKTHQTHYEQHGKLYARLSIDQQPEIPFELSTFRDHSFGVRREWKEFHRYALHFATFKNGYAFNVGVICIPASFTRLVIGYLYRDNDSPPVPIDGCDFQLEQHGEGGKAPSEYAFTFQADGRHYEVAVKIIDTPAFYIGWSWEVKVLEQLVNFTLDGVPGWGATEWVYRNLKGRPPLENPSWVIRP